MSAKGTVKNLSAWSNKELEEAMNVETIQDMLVMISDSVITENDVKVMNGLTSRYHKRIRLKSELARFYNNADFEALNTFLKSIYEIDVGSLLSTRPTGEISGYSGVELFKSLGFEVVDTLAVNYGIYQMLKGLRPAKELVLPE